LGTVIFNVARLIDAIMDLVFMIGVVFAISRTIRGILGGARRTVNGRTHAGQKTPPSAPQGRTARDPVCGMFVSTEVSHRLVEDGHVVHFCSKNCMESYEKRKARA
jgi:YHS domain-containing protein